MTDHLNDRFLAEAIRIGDNILSLTKKDKNGSYWETMTTAGDGVGWQTSEGIYSGVSGIVLFFIELYKKTNDPRYLNAITEGAKWVKAYCNDHETDYYAFYTGRMGAAYMMIQLAKRLGRYEYIEDAISIGLEAPGFLDRSEKVDDLINGISGTILGLIHLYDYSRDERLIPVIHQFAERLIQRAHLGAKGLYWDRSFRHIQGLCGFSHGACGIGYVFLELARYFQNPAFNWLAEQAFEYENLYYDDQNSNWPDFRKSYFDVKTFEEFKEKYKNGDVEFFHTPGNMLAWCHGAPGIGLSRLRAWELLGDTPYHSDFERAAKVTKEFEVDTANLTGSSVLCHGHSGNAMLFTEAYNKSGNDQYLEYARKTGELLLDYIAANKKYVSGYAMSSGAEDTSLFMGNAGIGYFYLTLINPKEIPSILKPDVQNEPDPIIKSPLKELAKTGIVSHLASKYFPGTLNGLQPDEFLYETKGPGLKEQIFDWLKKNIDQTADERLTSIFQFEKAKMELLDLMTSDAYISMKRVIDMESNASRTDQLTDDALLQLELELEQLSFLFACQWDCVDLSNTDAGDYYYLNSLHSDGVKTFELSEFSYDVLQLFINKNVVQDCIDRIGEMYEVDTEEEKLQVRTNVLLQVREALKSGALVSNT